MKIGAQLGRCHRQCPGGGATSMLFTCTHNLRKIPALVRSMTPMDLGKPIGRRVID